MAFHNTNWEIVNLSSGINETDVLGSPFTGKVKTHEVVCTNDGSAKITAAGGGTATFNMTKGQSLKIIPTKVEVISGGFAGLRARGNQFYFNMGG